MEGENQKQPFLFRFSGGLGVYPQRKGLRGFCKTFRPRKIFERMGMKKPHVFPPLGGRLLECSCARKPLVKSGKFLLNCSEKATVTIISGGIG